MHATIEPYVIENPNGRAQQFDAAAADQLAREWAVAWSSTKDNPTVRVIAPDGTATAYFLPEA